MSFAEKSQELPGLPPTLIADLHCSAAVGTLQGGNALGGGAGRQEVPSGLPVGKPWSSPKNPV